MYVSIETILSWPTPNYINPERYGPSIYIVHGIFYPFVVLILGIRVYTRLYISKCFGLDDWLALFSIIPATGFGIASMIVESYVGWDVHEWDAPPDTLALGLKWLLATQVLFSLSITSIRLSMLYLISRLFTNGAVRLRRFAIGFMVYMATHGLIFMTTLVFQCRPVSDYWKLSFVPQHTCINQAVHLLVTSIFNAVTDFVVVLLPIPTVWKLQMPVKQKWSLSLLFIAGFMASIASIIRTVYVYDSAAGSDRTWTAYPVFVWSSIEIYLGLICACIPPSAGFFKRYFPRILNTFGSKSESRSKDISHDSKSINGPNNIVRNGNNEDDEERGIIHHHITDSNGLYSNLTSKANHDFALKSFHSKSTLDNH